MIERCRGSGPLSRGIVLRSSRQMLKGFTHARLACGCRITFREGVEGSPVVVVVADKSPQCASTLHVAGLPVFDTRESLRPSTRLGPPEEEEYEEEG
jgi:hypothetical protein